MSRNDSHDLEYPPGLGFSRSANGDRGPLNGYHHHTSSGFSQPDRRPSLGVTYTNYAPSHGSMPRSVQDEYVGFGNSGGERWSAAPNRHTPAIASSQFEHLSSSLHHHSLRTSPPLPPQIGPNIANALFNPNSFSDYHSYYYHQSPPSNHISSPPAHSPPALNTTPVSSRSTLWWGELEPWMDEEYAKQVCGLMGWDPVNIKVPHPPPDPVTGQQTNNPGYCFLTFASPSQAASVLAQINNNGSSAPIAMPNSNKPLVLNWASSVPNTPLSASFPVTGAASQSGAQQQYPKEYSIFVGDLAPETSNSDLVAVFRNPVLGLRNDREPKFIRPFLSCKSAKIMLDPVTGVSRGYGFVRFTDESDQQRALIEMHGLYCLSRPMRISPATAKFKPPITVAPQDLPQVQFPAGVNGNGTDQLSQGVTLALPLPSTTQAKSVSAPIAATTSPNVAPTLTNTSNGVSSSTSGSTLSGSSSTPSLSSGSSSSTLASISSEDMLNLPPNILAQIAQQYANGNNGTSSKVSLPTTSITSQFAQDGQQQQDGIAPRYAISEESWKHHAQARAILGNLIGPNGEQLTSTDPYNTTVFVGGLSPLIAEETLRTFFAPFGDIHYVKVPVGKHCGFVQFVRKADAERAIEKMQGFPVGGSRIRLSWGRSQYKAAQAAAQAAQAAALQTQFPPQMPTAANVNGITPEQALQLLQKFGFEGLLGNAAASVGVSSTASTSESAKQESGKVGSASSSDNGVSEEMARSGLVPPKDSEIPIAHAFDMYTASGYAGRSHTNGGALDVRQGSQQTMNFSPFSPEPNLYVTSDGMRHASLPQSRNEWLPHPSKSYAPGFGPVLQTQDLKAVGSGSGAGSNSKVSPTSTRPSSASRGYAPFLNSSAPAFQLNRGTSRQEAPISRPTSTHASSQEPVSEAEEREQDSIQDLNGTLASLDLDQNGNVPWKVGEGSRFRMSMSSHPHSHSHSHSHSHATTPSP